MSITNKFFYIIITKMMELVDMLGLGSSSEKSRGSSPFFGKITLKLYYAYL